MRSLKFGVLAILVALAAGCGDTFPTNPPPPPPPPPPPTGAVVAVIAVTPPSTTMSPGATQLLSAVARNAAGQTVAATLTWQSSATGVATIDASGMVTAVTPGVTSITASSAGVTSNPVTVTVAATSGPVGSIIVDNASVLLPATGQTAQLTAQILNPQGSPSGGTVTWTSSAPAKVSVSSSGLLLAKEIGSAQIFAEAGGVRSAPTLVLVAAPQAGALLVTDAQVVSVGSPSGVGSQFEVTLQGVPAPAPGTVVLAAETAPVAGKVVSTRQTAAGLVVTLALAPLYQLFSDYNFSFNLDLSAFPVDAVPASALRSSRSARSTPAAVWTAARRDKRQRVAKVMANDVLAPFQNFECEASIKPKLLGTPIQLTLENNLKLVLDDRPGYSKHALEGSAALVGSAGLKLKAGFAGSGRCDAQVQLRLPVFGTFSILVMPAVRFGLGAELEGEVTVVQAELGVEGKIGFSPSLGWECGGTTPDCRGLDGISPLNEFKTKSKFPSEHDMQAKVSAHFYLLAGLDAAIAGGALNAKIVEARVGPKQSFDLAFEDDQIARRDYASSYDLKIEGVVEPGSALKKAIELVIDDDAVGVTFSAGFTSDLSESPKGSLSLSKVRVPPGEAVDFTVDLEPNTLAYHLLGYNVLGVELYRKRDDELEFSLWKSMSLIASNRATYKWTPVEADAGKYEFAALVNTQLPTPLLEVAPSSVRPLEVTCFSGGAPPGIAPQLATTATGTANVGEVCTMDWIGNASTVLFPGTPLEYRLEATVRWHYDAAASAVAGQNIALFYPTGTAKVTVKDPCVKLSPAQLTWNKGDPGTGGSLRIDYNPAAPTYSGSGGAQWFATGTDICDPENQPQQVPTGGGWFLAPAPGTDTLSGAGFSRITGTTTFGGQTFTFTFDRIGSTSASTGAARLPSRGDVRVTTP